MIYELHAKKSYNESLSATKSVITYMKSCKFDETNKQYIKAYNHIAQSTYAYIELTLNLDSKMVILNYLLIILVRINNLYSSIN